MSYVIVLFGGTLFSSGLVAGNGFGGKPEDRLQEAIRPESLYTLFTKQSTGDCWDHAKERGIQGPGCCSPPAAVFLPWPETTVVVQRWRGSQTFPSHQALGSLPGFTLRGREMQMRPGLVRFSLLSVWAARGSRCCLNALLSPVLFMRPLDNGNFFLWGDMEPSESLQ